MRNFVYISILFIILPFFSEAQDKSGAQDQIVNKPYSERSLYFLLNFYNNPINQDSIRYFKEVNRLKALALKYNDRELYLETIYMRLNFLSLRNYKNHVSEIYQLIQTADEENILQLQIRARQELGFHYYYQHNNYGKAIFYFLKSYEYIQKVDDSEFPERQEALSNIAYICYNTGYENKAKKYVKEAKAYNNANEKPVLMLNLTNTEGLIYLKYGEKEKAENAFKEILKKANSNTPWQLIASGNLANLYYNSKRYDEALDVLNNCPDTIDKKKYSPTHYEEELIHHALLYAEIYLQKGNMVLFNESMKKVMKSPASAFNNLKIKQRLFYLYYKYYAYQNDLKKSVSYSDSLIATQKQLNEIVHANSIKIAVEKDNYDLYVKKDNAFKQERKRNSRLKFIYFSVSILLVSFILFFYIRKRKKYRTEIVEQQRKLLEKEEEIKNAQLYLEKFISENRKKEQIINELSEKVTGGNKQSLLDMLILTDDDWVKFKKEFTIVYPIFFNELKSISPKITPALERLAALLFIGLDNSQIAHTLGIGKESVSRTKRRLREYLQIPADMDFKTWFESK